MSTLHTIARSPSSRLLDSCLSVLNQGDAILFLEDGVYYSTDAELLAAAPKTCHLFGLREDLTARGLKEKCQPQVEFVSTKKFVKLCCDFDQVLNWF